MDSLYAKEVAFIHALQKHYRHKDEWLLFFSHLGDPKLIFYIYFPLFYTINKTAGLHIVWLTIFADWSNFMLKWILRGPRPYWWVFVTSHYAKSSTIFPHLKHFPITCETGPGNPSGHVMVSTAMYLGILHYILKAYPLQSFKPYGNHLQKILGYTALLSIITSIGLSRLYIAAHFPHQIIFGGIGGVTIWYIITYLYKPECRTIKHNFAMCFAILISGLILYSLLYALDMHPDHSVAMAFKFCALRSFVNFNTNPLVSLTRTVGTHFGVTLSSYLTAYFQKRKLEIDNNNNDGEGKELSRNKDELAHGVGTSTCYKRINGKESILDTSIDAIIKRSTNNDIFDNSHLSNNSVLVKNINKRWCNISRFILSLSLSLFVGYIYFVMPHPTEYASRIFIYIFTFLKYSTFMIIIITLIPCTVDYIYTLCNPKNI